MSKTFYRLFPILKIRSAQMAASLSGGQQQILALGMALMTRPRILLLDEPSTGLAPVIVQDIMDSLMRINRETGTTMVIVEQNVPATLKITPRDRVEIGLTFGIRWLPVGSWNEKERFMGVVLNGRSPGGDRTARPR